MDKQNLALAFEFQNAPSEVKDAATEHRENFFRYEKACSQLDLWRKEKDKAKEAFLKSQNAFQKALKTWDPIGLKNNALEEKEG